MVSFQGHISKTYPHSFHPLVEWFCWLLGKIATLPETIKNMIDFDTARLGIHGFPASNREWVEKLANSYPLANFDGAKLSSHLCTPWPVSSCDDIQLWPWLWATLTSMPPWQLYWVPGWRSSITRVAALGLLWLISVLSQNKGSCTYYVITFGGPERPPPM